jgi:hypothetical protein
MWADTVTAITIYVGVMCALGAAVFYLKWDR